MKLDTEQWRSIPGWEGFYEVSSLGKVRSSARQITRSNGRKQTFKERLRKTSICSSTGYPKVLLYRDGKGVNHSVHRLMALAFFGPPREGEEVRHLNDIGTDNRLENLLWGTSQENSLDMISNGNHPPSNKIDCKWGHPLDSRGGDWYVSRGERPRRVCRICRRRRLAEHRERKRREKQSS